MATGRKRAVNSGRKRERLNTTWLNNAMRSIGAATAATFKDISPTMYSMGAATAKGASAAATKVRQTKASIGKLNSAIASNKYIQLAKKTMDQSIDDLKTGHLYNEHRDTGSDDFGDFDDMFGDFDSEDSGAPVVNIMSEGNSSENNEMVVDAITRAGQMNIKASKASVDAMIALTSTSMNTQLESLSRIESGINDVNDSIRGLIQYHEENTTKFYEEMIGAMERIGKTVDDMDRDSSGPEDLFNSRGGIDGSAYKKYIKKNIKNAVDRSPVGMLLPFLKDDQMIEMLASDPIGGITKGVIGGMIPAVVSGTLHELDNAVSNLIPNALANLSKAGANPNSSKAMRLLSEIFGIKTDKVNNINMDDHLNKSAATFDDVTRNTIVEVLPKYARESTSYLRAIAMHVTHKKDSDLLSGQQIFDPKEFKYKSQEELQKSIAEELKESITTAFKEVDFGKILSSAGSDLGDKDKKRFDKTLDQFFVQLSNFDNVSAKDFNLKNRRGAAYQALQGVNGKGRSAQSKKLLTEALKYMYENNVGIDSATLGNIKARSGYSRKVSELQRDPEMSNILAAGINNKTDLAEFVDKYTGNKAALNVREAARKRERKEALSQVTKTAHPFMSAKARASQNISSQVEYTRDVDKPNTGWITNNLIGSETAGKISAAGGHAKDVMFSIMKGDTKGALNNFSQIFTDIAGSAWSATKEGFFKPLSKHIFGEKEAKTGKSVGGLLSGIKNSTNDTWKAVVQKINGKSYKDSEGKVHEVDDMNNTLVGKAGNIFKEIGHGINVRLFGEKKANDKKDEKNNPGVISTMITSLKEGISGWKEVLFGPSDDKDHKKDIAEIKKNVVDALPDALVGVGSGAILGAMSGGSLLGALIGGPVGGAVIGLAGGLLSRSDKFKDWLFGPEVDDGKGGKERIGGFISKKAQDFIGKNKSTIIGGAALGAMKSIIFPNSVGLLTSVVGGPIAGAAIGAGFGLIKNSDMFQKFLYGDEETGKRGVIQAIKGVFSGKKNNGEKTSPNVLKALGMGAVGAAGAGLTASLIGKVGLMGAMVTPGGPIGAAVLGAAVGIGSSSEKFREWIFGKEDEESGKRKGGLVQKFGNYVQVEMLQPMKSKVLDIVDDAKNTLKYDILENIRIPFIAAADKVKEKIDAGLKKVGDLGKSVAENVGTHIVKPVGTIVDHIVVQPLKKVTSTVTDFVYKGTKAIVTAPFKLVGALYKRAIHKKGFIRKGLESLFSFTRKKIASGIKIIGKGALSILKLGAKGVGAIGGTVKGLAGRAKDKLEARNPGLVSKIGKVLRQRRIDNEDDANAKEFLQGREEAREARRKAKEDRRDRRNLDKNRRMMAKILGYDERFFTEDTMAKAEAVAGKKINWAGTNDNRKFDQTPEQKRAEILKKNRSEILSHGETSTDMEVRHLTEEMKTNQKLDSIYDVLYKTYRSKKADGASDAEIADFLGDQRDEMAAGEKAAGLKKYNRKHGGAAADLPKDNDELLEHVQNWGDKVVDELDNTRKSTSDKVAQSIRKNGILGSLRGLFKKGETRSSSDIESWLNDGTIDNLDDPETNKKLMNMIFDKNHKRADGGNMKKGETYLVGEGGSDPAGAEIVVPNQDSKVLSQKNNGIKVTLSGIEDSALSHITNFFSKAKEKMSTLNIFKRNSDKERGEMNQAEQRGTYATQLLANVKKAEEEKQTDRDNTQKGILKALLAMGKGNKKHHNLWETIFSKKGLIGAGLIALLPFLWNNKDTIINGITSIASAVGSILSSMGSQAEWTSKNNARDNGNTAMEQLGHQIDRQTTVASDLFHGKFVSAAADFVLDDGEYDAHSGGRASLLANGARSGVKKAKPAINVAKKVANFAKGIGSKAKNRVVGKVAGKAAASDAINYYGLALNPDGSVKLGEEAAQVASHADDAVNTTKGIRGLANKVKNRIIGAGKDEVVESASKAVKGKVTTESVEKVAENANKAGASKVCKIISGFFEKIATKCAEKASVSSKTVEGPIKKVLTKVTSCIMDKFGKISGEISKIFAGKGSLEVATAGLSTAAFVTLGLINGGGKGATARLFQVSQDKVDAKMRLISAAFNGFTAGTVTGAVVDVVCGLVADVLGIDMLNFIACTIYKAMSSDKKDNALTQAQSEWKNAYLDYQDKELDKNYETQKKLGNISSDMTAEEYKAGVKSGKYKATYKGFDDWNADKNKSLGSRVGKGVTKGWRAVKGFVAGKTSYKDANGNVYANIGDNQYQVYGADGKKIGVVSKDSVDVSNMEKTTKGGIKNGLKSVGHAIGSTAGKAAGAVVDLGKKAYNKGGELVGKVKSSVTSFAKGAGETIGGFIKKIGDVNSAIRTGQAQIEKNFNNKDIDFKGYFSADVNPMKKDNPMHGLVSGLLNGSKIVSFVPLIASGILRKVGKAIGGFVSKQAEKVTKASVDINTQQDKLQSIAKAGNLTALNSYKYEPSDDNPLAGISKAVVGVNKFFMYPSAFLHLAGNSIKKFVSAQFDKVKKSSGNISSEMSKITKASTGGIKSLSAYSVSIDEDNPMAGFTNGILTIDKIVHYPNALLYTIGNGIKSAINKVIGGIKSIGTGSSDTVKEMYSLMKSGDLSGIIKYKPKVADGTPIAGFVNGILGIGKLTLVPGTAIHKVGDIIHNKITSSVDKIKDVGTEIKSYASTLLSYTNPDKDMSGFNKEKFGDDSIIGKIVAPIMKSALKIYVNIRRGLNRFSDFIGDKVDDIKDTASNAKDTVVNGAKSVRSKISRTVNDIGTKIMNFGRGGRGDEPDPEEVEFQASNKSANPEKVNGAEYFSQNDSKWKSRSYESSKAKDGATMGDSGCGPTAMAMAVSQQTKGKVTPTSMADLASKTGFRDKTGTNAGFIDYAGDVYGLDHQDVVNPSADYVKNQVANGNSVVLNGYSDGNKSSAYTKAGHYVVAVGTDKNGNILVNDPRGKEYSKAYNPDKLANETSEAWSFNGGHGKRRGSIGGFGKAIARKVFKKFGGRGVSGDWLSIVKSVKKLVAAQHPTYNQSGSMTINYNGKTIRLRPDCSGLVGCMLRIYGAIPEGQNVTSSSLLNKGAIKDGFTYGGWTGWDNLKEGDIITRNGHVEIFCRNEGGQHYVYNGGSTKALCSPGATVTGHPQGYTAVWRPGNAGTGGDVVSGGSSDSSSSSGGITDLLSNVTNVFSKYSTAVLNGAVSGNYDASQITWNDTSSSSTGSSDDSSIVPAAVNAGTVAKTLWNYFTGKAGYSKAATAAILGNLQQESGLNPANTKGRVAGGLAQWERYDQKTGRWKKLYDYAASKGKQWTDAAIQAEFINKELNSSDINQYFGKDVKYGKGIAGSTLSNAGATPTTFAQWKQSNDVGMATRQFEGAYERAGKPMIEKRVAYAKKFYETYAGGGKGDGPVSYERPYTTGGFGKTATKTLSVARSSSKNFSSSLSNQKTLSTKEKMNYGVGSNANVNKSTDSSFDTKALALMESMIDVLKEIGVNTSNLEAIKNNQSTTSVNNSKTAIINKNTTQSNSNSSNSTPSDSSNAKLAAQIARGY